MHKFAKQIMECVKAKVEGIGIDNIENQNLEELKMWTEIAKNIVCYDKDYKIVEAMEESENNDNMRAIEMYEDYPERRYYDNYRYKTSGRFAPKGKGSYMPRRGYEEPPYNHMNPEMYREHDPEYWRDMDRDVGIMYYSGKDAFNPRPGAIERANARRFYGIEHDAMDGKSWQSRKSYMEAKQLHKSNTPEDKQRKLKELEAYMNELSGDITEMIVDSTPEEKTMLKSKLTTLVQKL